MAKRNTSIEINGKRYDAITGQLLGATVRPVATAPNSIDGVITAKKAPLAVAIPAPITPRAPKQPTMDVTSRRHTKSARSQQPKPSATLMRHAVQKPAGSVKRRLQVQSSTLQLSSKPTITIKPKWSLASVDPKRQAHAAATVRSDHISRFGAFTTSAATIATSRAAAPATTRPSLAARPVSATKPLDIFEQALARATSHEQLPVPKKELKRSKRAANKARRRLHYAASTLAVVLLFGFIAYQNVANVTLKLATAKAGFAATLPGYHPSGFAIGKFSYSPGSVAVDFHSTSDSRHFALVEKPSNWDSSTLLSNFVATATGSTYQTVAAAGRTVYVYGQNNATWVANGVWYQIQGNNALSDRQLSELAASM